MMRDTIGMNVVISRWVSSMEKSLFTEPGMFRGDSHVLDLHVRNDFEALISTYVSLSDTDFVFCKFASRASRSYRKEIAIELTDVAPLSDVRFVTQSSMLKL